MNLLVVCTANMARSPLAEAMLAADLAPHGVRLASAGTRARLGSPATAESQQLARALGLDLGSHRARPVDDPLLGGAHLVLTMSRRHRDELAPRTPGGAARTFTLAELLRLLEMVDDTGAPTTGPADRLAWLAGQAHRVRPRARPGGDEDDIPDPMGREWPYWEQMANRLDGLIGALTRRTFGGVSST
jgi:protein-tyrosine phosphatase